MSIALISGKLCWLLTSHVSWQEGWEKETNQTHPAELIRSLEQNLHLRRKLRVCSYITEEKTLISEQKSYPSLGISISKCMPHCLYLVPITPLLAGVIQVLVWDTKWNGELSDMSKKSYVCCSFYSWICFIPMNPFLYVTYFLHTFFEDTQIFLNAIFLCKKFHYEKCLWTKENGNVNFVWIAISVPKVINSFKNPF